MVLTSDGTGKVRLTQRLVRPVVYLDHWAIRLLSDEQALQDRFVRALHDSGGTWLFSAVNLMEFTAMTDIQQAQATEHLLGRVLPVLHVADTVVDKGYLIPEGAPSASDAPDAHWMLTDLAHRALIADGAFNTHRFISDAIDHADNLLPQFEAVKAAISKAVMALVHDPEKSKNAKRFVPSPGMTLRDALFQELIRDPHLNADYVFSPNDAVDLIHALPAAVVCDFVLLDARWCNKVAAATRRLRQGGIKGKLAECFSKKTFAAFLSKLEAIAAVK